MKALIHQHLGLGDHIVCNGLIREICASAPHIYYTLAAKQHNFDSVAFMFADVPNLKVAPVRDDLDVDRLKTADQDSLVKIGHEFLDQTKPFDVAFYHQFNLDFSFRWSSFHVQRDYEKEEALFDAYNISTEYVFVHDDPARGMAVTRSIPEDVRIIRTNPARTRNLFDYLSILENARELHCIESSFLFLIDSFNFKAPKFSHRYARQYPANNAPTLKSKWNILR